MGIGDAEVKNPPANAGDTRDMGSIPGSGRSPWKGNGNPLQYSCLENSMDRGPWCDRVHGVPKTWQQLSTHSTRGMKLGVLEDLLPLKPLCFLLSLYLFCIGNIFLPVWHLWEEMPEGINHIWINISKCQVLHVRLVCSTTMWLSLQTLEMDCLDSHSSSTT